jgi:S1-C subfamily serine protease
MARDADADLALLEADLNTTTSLNLRTTPARPAEPVVVAGFPLQGVLASGAQVSTGIVTALAGLRDDASRIQISAPIQPGNSGGPVLDREGMVIGIATSTIGTLAATIATGTMPQNVNFAVKADRVNIFLAAAGISAPPQEPSTTPRLLAVEDVATRAIAAVALVECIR